MLERLLVSCHPQPGHQGPVDRERERVELGVEARAGRRKLALTPRELLCKTSSLNHKAKLENIPGCTHQKTQPALISPLDLLLTSI